MGHCPDNVILLYIGTLIFVRNSLTEITVILIILDHGNKLSQQPVIDLDFVLVFLQNIKILTNIIKYIKINLYIRVNFYMNVNEKKFKKNSCKFLIEKRY